MSTPPLQDESQNVNTTPDRKITSPNLKRTLFSPTSNSANFDNSKKRCYDDKLNMSGYIVKVFEQTPAKNHFSLLLKISMSEIIQIMIVKKTNIKMKRECFLKFLNKQVMLTNLTKSDNANMYFFNNVFGSQVVGVNNLKFKVDDYEFTSIKDVKESTSESVNVIGCFRWQNKAQQTSSTSRSPGKAFREGAIHDGKDFIPLTVWENEIDSIHDDQCYSFINVKLRNYYHAKLTCSPTTIILESDKISANNIDWTVLDMTDLKKIENERYESNFPTLVCPSIISTKVEMFAICSFPECQKKLDIVEDSKYAICVKNHRSTKKNLQMQFSAEIVLLHDEKTLSLTVFPDTLNTYFNKDIVNEYANNVDGLEELILDIENVDICYSSSKKVIKSITEHEEKEDLV